MAYRGLRENAEPGSGSLPAPAACEGERRLALAEQLANLGTWSLDPATGLFSRSAQADAILDIGAGEPVGIARLLDKIAAGDRFSFVRCMARALAGKRPQVLCQVRMNGPGVGERLLIVSARRDDPTGLGPQLFGIVQDVSRLAAMDDLLTAMSRPRAPLAEARSAPVATEPASADDLRGQGARMLRILIAEDNAISQMLVATMMRRKGHRVTCVDNGRRAIEAALAMPFDCILMDMNMPEIDGVQATRAIRESGGRHALVPIIALTADGRAERRRFYENIGLSGFLTKPVDREKLFAAVNLIACAAPVLESRPGPVPAIDFDHLGDIQSTIGVVKVERLLEMACAELTARPQAMRALANGNDLPLLRREAHGFKGAVASVGLVAAARAAKAVELALPGAELHHSLDRLESEANRALVAVRSLLAQCPAGAAAGA